MDEWFDLTGKIKQNAWRSEGGKPDEYLAKLLRDRRALLETASGKVSKLEALLDEEDAGSLRHTLVYTSDKGAHRHLPRCFAPRNAKRYAKQRGALRIDPGRGRRADMQDIVKVEDRCLRGVGGFLHRQDGR